MQLRDINKITYRAHLRYTTIVCIIMLFVGALTTSALLVQWLGHTSDSNFYLNVLSVALTITIMGSIAYNKRTHPYFSEMYYVALVKFELSHINRKIKLIEKSCDIHNTVALDVMAYYYQGTKQVWSLDDNTLAMNEFTIKENKFIAITQACDYTTDVTRYHRELLKQF